MASIKYLMPVILVEDIAISKQFYQDIFSLEIENDFGENIVFKEAFSIWQKKRAEEIIFKSKRKIKAKEIKSTELYFESDDIEEIWEKIKEKAVELIHGLKEEPWGQKTIRFFDPDMYIIEVAEPMEQVILRLGKQGLSEVKISNKTQMPIEIVKQIINENG